MLFPDNPSDIICPQHLANMASPAQPVSRQENTLALHPESAKKADKDGFLGVGELGIERMLQAYRSGIFPWQEVRPGSGLFSWWSPDPRMVIMPDSLHVSRRLQRKLRSGKIKFTVNRAFAETVRGCARIGNPAGAWITAELARHYIELHRTEHAISIEAWQNGSLAGGLFGILVGSCIIGESMFSPQPDGSKACLAWLCAQMAGQPDALLDCQIPSSHLLRLGGKPIRREKYLRLLEAAAAHPPLQLAP